MQVPDYAQPNAGAGLCTAGLWGTTSPAQAPTKPNNFLTKRNELGTFASDSLGQLDIPWHVFSVALPTQVGMVWYGMVDVCEGAPVAVSGWVLDRHDLAPCAANSLHWATISVSNIIGGTGTLCINHTIRD